MTRVLVSTLPLWGGGVRTMTRCVLRWLRQRGCEPVVAYHQPYSIDPSLSVPGFALPWKRVQQRRVEDAEGTETHELGAWLPELEFMHYYPTADWRGIIQSCEAHVAVSGNCLAAMPLARSGRPFVSWIATPWREDRLDRETRFGPLRRIWDSVAVRPMARRLERSILRTPRCRLLALSDYTRTRLDGIAGHPVVAGTLPNPVEADVFQPAPERVVPGRIGFTGRLDDPRKNVRLFLEAIALGRRRGLDLTGVLVGGRLSPTDLDLVRTLRLDEAVTIQPHAERVDLPAILQTLDVYLVPSRQEGLCIAALEAMACGCPVVSTRCGGPEEFVRDGDTGYLVGFDATEAADAIQRIVGDREARGRLSAAARATVSSRYSEAHARRTFDTAFDETFGGTSECRAS